MDCDYKVVHSYVEEEKITRDHGRCFIVSVILTLTQAEISRVVNRAQVICSKSHAAGEHGRTITLVVDHSKFYSPNISSRCIYI